MKILNFIIILIISTLITAQNIELKVLENSSISITSSGFSSTDQLILYRSTSNLANIDINTTSYPILKYEFPNKSEIVFCDSIVAANVTYFYKAVINIPNKSISSNIVSVQIPEKQLSQLSNPYFLIDKLNYVLEVYDNDELVKSYPIAMGGNPVKRKLNQDNQSTPEGVYTIYNLQPIATYYKAYDINYPNPVDRARYGYYRRNNISPFDSRNPGIGSEIQIHGCGIGNNWTWGCVSLRNDDIDELFSQSNIRAGMKVIIIGSEFERDDVEFLKKSRDKEFCRILQLSLKDKGFYSGSIDGQYGPQTGKAVAKFQADKNLIITCDFDKETTELLLKDPRIEWVDDLEKSIRDEEDIVIHCFVALCSNEYQGIVPVLESLGKADDPNGNLYWGAGGGVRTFFNRNQDWRRIKKYTINDTILERVVYHRNVNGSNFYLVADAYHGKYIMNTLDDFLQSSAGNNNVDIELEDKTIQAGGNSRLLAYVGHDVLMDSIYTKQIIENNIAQSREIIILACISKSFFNEQISETGAYPLLWTTGLMAPEAYTLEAAIEGWLNCESSYEIRMRAAKAYKQYQNCGFNAALNLLVSGW